MKHLLICLIGLNTLLFGQESPDLSQYQDLTENQSDIPVLFENFDTTLPHWRLPSGCRLDPQSGMTGTNALSVERSNPDNYSSAVAELSLKLVPGRYYKVSVYHRSLIEKEGLGYSVMLGIVQSKGGKQQKVVAPGKIKSNDQWQKVEMPFLAAEENTLRLSLFYQVIGKAWFDNLRIEEVGGNKGTVYPIAPPLLNLNDDGQIRCKAYVWEIPPSRLTDHAVLIELNHRKQLAPVQNSEANVYFGEVPPGNYQATAFLLNQKNRTIVAKDQFAIFRRPPAPIKPPGSVEIDRHKRFLVDGKPYLPIGIFVTWLRTEDDLKRIAAAHFNFVLVYTSWGLNIQKTANEISRQSPGGPKNYGSPEWRQRISSSLDLIDQYGLKLVSTSFHPVFNHPALLARYTADERPVTMLPSLRKTREKLSAEDPFHPVIALTDKPEDFLAYGKIADILGIDPYPILNSNSKSMQNVRRHLEEANWSGLPIMFVPQAFNWGGHKKDPYQSFAYPTEQQMRSMVLLAVAFEVKMFCFYSYTTIMERQEAKDPGSSRIFWPKVAAVSTLLRQLEPWILSLEQAPRATVRPKTGSQVDVKTMKANGKLRVVITACGPGKAEAHLTIPNAENLKSKFGKTENCGNGEYLFRGTDIDSDLLFEEEIH